MFTAPRLDCINLWLACKASFILLSFLRRLRFGFCTSCKFDSDVIHNLRGTKLTTFFLSNLFTGLWWSAGISLVILCWGDITFISMFWSGEQSGEYEIGKFLFSFCWIGEWVFELLILSLRRMARRDLVFGFNINLMQLNINLM